jgi:hypothetical protein
MNVGDRDMRAFLGRANVTRFLGHSLSDVSFGLYFGENPNVRSKRLA